MNEEKGLLDDIEELVDDFQKKKPSLKNFDFVNKNIRSLTDFRKQYHPEKYMQKYPPEPEYNEKILCICECGTNYNIYINQDEELVEYIGTVGEPDFFANFYEKSFFCIKCGEKLYIRMNSNFKIISIKHEEILKI